VAANAACKNSETALHWVSVARVMAIEAADVTQDAVVASLSTTVGQQQTSISSLSDTISEHQDSLADLSDVAWEPGIAVDDVAYTRGNVGIGTADPAFPLQVGEGQGTLAQFGAGAFLGYFPLGAYLTAGSTLTSTGQWVATASSAAAIGVHDAAWGDSIIFLLDAELSPGTMFGPTPRMILKNNGDVGLGGALQSPADGALAGAAMVIVNGDVGIGTPSPSAELHVEGTIYASGGVSSSRTLKENILPLSAGEAATTLDQLLPVKFNYKSDPQADTQLGFIAEDVPELVATPKRKGIQPLDIIAVLTKALQTQQERIAALEWKLARLEAAAQSSP
jgi:hypothetical protein